MFQLIALDGGTREIAEIAGYRAFGIDRWVTCKELLEAGHIGAAHAVREIACEGACPAARILTGEQRLELRLERSHLGKE